MTTERTRQAGKLHPGIVSDGDFAVVLITTDVRVRPGTGLGRREGAASIRLVHSPFLTDGHVIERKLTPWNGGEMSN